MNNVQHHHARLIFRLKNGIKQAFIHCFSSLASK